MVEEIVPGSRVDVRRRAAAPTCATTASTATRSPRRCRASSRSGPCGGASRSSTTPTRRSGLTLEDFVSARFLRIKHVKELQPRAARRRAPLAPGDGTACRPRRAVVPLLRALGGRLAVFLSLGELPLADALLRADELASPSRATRSTSPSAPTARSSRSSRRCRPSSCSSTTTPTSRRSPTRCCATPATRRAARSRSAGSGRDSLVVELASNDGYLLRNFAEPASRCSASTRRRTGAAAEAAGVPTLQEFFGAELARAAGDRGHARRRDRRQQRAGAHARPERLRRGHARSCSPTAASSTIENPTSSDLIDHCEFDTIYHEHLCYFSCSAVRLR